MRKGRFLGQLDFGKYIRRLPDANQNLYQQLGKLRAERQIRKEETVGIFLACSNYKGNLARVDLALAKNKSKYDKRATLKRKAIQRDIEREMRIR